MIEKFYLAMPSSVQNMAISLKGYSINKSRYDELFFLALDRLNSNSFENIYDVKCYQEKQFGDFLRNVSSNKLSLDRFEYLYGSINRFSTLSDLDNLKVTTKLDIQKCLKALPGKVKGNDLMSHTSGTTGSGLVYPVSKISDAFQWAVWWRYRNNHGIDFDTKCGYFGGRTIVSMSESQCYYRYNAAAKQLMFSAYHLNERTLFSYVAGLVKHKIKWLHGYPSFLSNFASLCLEAKIDLSSQIEIVTIGAESLLPSQEAVIYKAFGCNAIQHYGLSEGVANISQNVDGNLVVDEDFSFVKFKYVNKNSHKIIGSNFYNYATPFLNYDTGDVASIVDSNAVMRHVRSIDGRQEDMILLADGTKVGRLDHIFKDIYQVKEVQIQQITYDDLHVLLVKGVDFDDAIIDKIIAEFSSRLPIKVNLTFEYVERIQRSDSGKLRFVISKLGKN